MPEELVDITPSPRILQVLGDIEFDHWQCLAELVDNGFDEFLDIKSEGLEWDEFVVTVALPKSDDPTRWSRSATTAGGWTWRTSASRPRWLQRQRPVREARSLRDGVQHRDRTARRRGEVLSKRDGDAEWRGVRIDLRKISQRGEFKAPVVSEQADDPTSTAPA